MLTLKACLTQNTVGHTVYSVIHGLTGMSIELQTCLGMSWYNLDSNVARVCTKKARFAKRFSYHCCTFQVQSSTVCYSLVQLNTTFTRLTGHLQGLHTVPRLVWVWIHTIYIRYWHGWAHSWSGLHVRLYIRSRTVLYDSLYDYT